MFNFTTQTIFNTVEKATVAEIQSGSKTNYNLIVAGAGKQPEVRFGNVRFTKEYVEAIFEANHTDEHLAKVTFDMSKITAQAAKDVPGTYRIALYIGLSMNSQDALYANDFVYKGKPLYFEFPVNAGDDAAAIAKRAVSIIKKYQLVLMGEKILNVRANEGTVVIEGTNGYQQFKKAELQKYDPQHKTVSCCGFAGDYDVMVKGVPVNWTGENGVITVGEQTLGEDGVLRDLEDNEVAIEPGLEAFLDYNWIMHNLRLPTLANTYIWSPNRDEQPVVGGKYVQFIIRMCKERDGIAGGILGQRATTVTTHVLYVLDSGNNVSDVRAELTKLLATGKNIETPADTSFNNPFA